MYESSNDGLKNNSLVEFAVTTGSSSANVLLSGSGTVEKTGSSTLTLSNAYTYSGATTVSDGTLTLTNTYASKGFAVAGGATLEFNVASGARDLATTTFSDTGNLRKTGTGQAVWGGRHRHLRLGKWFVD